jgi:hypothetical protein
VLAPVQTVKSCSSTKFVAAGSTSNPHVTPSREKARGASAANPVRTVVALVCADVSEVAHE